VTFVIFYNIFYHLHLLITRIHQITLSFAIKTNLKQSAIIELHFLPSIAWFSLFSKYDCEIESFESYRKGSYRNRCHILGPNGLQRLTVPLKKGKNNLRIKEVELAYDMPWQKNNWNSIQTAYGKSPFFEYYEDDLKAVFLTPKEFLFDYNIDLIKVIIESLDLDLDLKFTHDFQKTPTEILDFRNQITPKKIPNDVKLVAYEQVFEAKYGFVKNLSILDLLFCKGPESVLILDSFTN